MSITVRIIFWGLIGFVPNPEGHKGLTALLVNPGPVQDAAHVNLLCRVPEHLAAVYLLDGQCDSGGDCLRIPRNGLGDAQRMGFLNPVGSLLPLRWLLKGEDLDLVGDEDASLELRKPFLKSSRKTVPGSARQARYFSWLQSMDTLTGGLGKVRPECLDDREGCSLNARFKLQGGTAGACHLVHKVEPWPYKDTQRNLRIFDYKIAGRPSFKTAVADAMSVDIEIQGDSLLLLSKELPGHPQGPVEAGRPPRTAWARLRPNDKGKLTLVVVNLPGGSQLNEDVADHDSHGTTQECPARPHSDILFDLLAQSRKSMVVERTTDGTTRRADPGSCELEADKLAKLLTGSTAPEIPHSTSACDGASYP